MLVSDAMTMSGRILGINRYGIVKEKPSVLARASFETPIKHIIQASITAIAISDTREEKISRLQN